MRFKSSEPAIMFQVIYHCCRRPWQDLIRLARAPITDSDNKTQANHVALKAHAACCVALRASRSSAFPHHES